MPGARLAGAGHGGDRSRVQQSMLQTLSRTPSRIVPFVQSAVNVFSSKGWSSGYGGRRWARICKTLLDYLTGKLSRVVFIDRVFDLRHNGGELFDKHPMVSSNTYEEQLREQLRIKRKAENLKGLFERLNRYSRHVSSDTVRLYQAVVSAKEE